MTSDRADKRGPEEKEGGMSAGVTETISRLREGEIVTVTDDDDRENEGDLEHFHAERNLFPIERTR
jgi:hypothetical protein